MDLNRQLRKMKEEPGPLPQEEKIRKTISKGREIYLLQEQDQWLSYWEFLWGQLQYARKRWWVMQAGLLLAAFRVIPAMEGYLYRVRSIGVIGCLFVVLMIPELWRNRENDAIQVEAACLYSLRQVYAARIMLFGMVDVSLLTCFGLGLGYLGFSAMEVLIQFILPVTVTSCICFSLLCGKCHASETVSMAACLIWCGIWWLILMNERIYGLMVPAVWISLLGIALAFLAWTIRRTIVTTNQYWEVGVA